MGCDGGTIPRRDELVKLKKKPEQKDKDAELSFKWRHCSLSQQVLQEPIVACGLGRLYSKSAVIEGLLDKANMPENIKHIKNLKDIKDLKLKKNPAYMAKAEKTEGGIDERGSPYICPIIGIEMSGRFRFVFLWSCGCVMSERAFKEVKQKHCHLCLESYESSDVVVLNGSNEDIEKMKINMEQRQSKIKQKKNKKKLEAAASSTSTSTVTSATDISSTSNDETTVASSTSTSATSSTTDNPIKKIVVKDEAGCIKRGANASTMQDPVYKKSKLDYSVAKDPKSTEVYKSIFTSHQSEKSQQRAHWITYNPFYN